MEQVKVKRNFWEKYSHLLVIVTGFCVALYVIFGTYTKNTDEVWTFSNIYKMILGGKIYVDNNVIQTPLFFLVGKYLLLLMKPNMLCFKIYNLLIYLFLVEVFYQLFLALEFSRKKTAIATIGCAMISIVLVSAGANYNVLVYVFVLLGIVFHLKFLDTKLESFLQGCICYLVFITKQNVGVFYIVATIGYYVVQGIRYKTFKQQIVKIMKEMGIAGVLLIGTLVSMHLYGNLQGFINYALLGIGEFSQSNGSGIIYDILTEIFLGIFMILLTFILIKGLKIDQKKGDNIVLLVSYMLPNLLIAYPIANIYHLTLANFLPLIIFIYIIDLLLIQVNKKIKWLEKTLEIITCLIMITFIVIGPIQLVYYLNNCEKTPAVYYGAIFEEEQKQNLETVCNYIQQKQSEGISVKIISAKALFYMTPLKLNNGAMDLPLRGNLGKEGEDGLVQQISELKNAEILITKDEDDMVYQESLKVRKYIQEHFTKIGEVEEFYIYQTE